VEVNPGETLILPRGWFHQVRSLDPAFSLAWEIPIQLTD